MGSQSQRTPRCPGYVRNIFYSAVPHVDTRFCIGDLGITEAALWEERRLKGLASLSLLLPSLLKAPGVRGSVAKPGGTQAAFPAAHS